jgi:hypothetical protein
MTEVQDTTDRKAKWVRDIALAIALIWASVWTFNTAATALIAATPSRPAEWIARFTLGGWLTIAVLLVVPWASVAVARTRAVIGGIMLVPAGLLSSQYGWLMFIGALPHTPAMDPGNQMPFLPCILLSLATPVPAMVAGCLFLISWWRSRTQGSPQNSEWERG